MKNYGYSIPSRCLCVQTKKEAPDVTRRPALNATEAPETASSQLTVGTWFKLYSLALSRRLAMLLAMFIPWDVLVLEQVGG